MRQEAKPRSSESGRNKTRKSLRLSRSGTAPGASLPEISVIGLRDGPSVRGSMTEDRRFRRQSSRTERRENRTWYWSRSDHIVPWWLVSPTPFCIRTMLEPETAQGATQGAGHPVSSSPDPESNLPGNMPHGEELMPRIRSALANCSRSIGRKIARDAREVRWKLRRLQMHASCRGQAAGGLSGPATPPP